MKDRLLVVGGDGLLGGALVAGARSRGWDVLATTRRASPLPPGWSPLDLAGDVSSWSVPSDVGAAVLCAAVTRIEACRQDPLGTRHVNVSQTLALAKRLSEAGVFIVFLSTNQVFDGTRALTAADAARSPRTEYGRQKAEVEAALERLGPGVAVVRLTKVVHAGWPLIATWAETLRAGRSVEAFSDMRCAPILLSTVVEGLADIAGRKAGGVWQFSAPTDIPYSDLAMAVARSTGADAGLVRGARSAGRSGAEPVPEYTALDTERARRELGLSFPEAAGVVQTLVARPVPHG